MQHPKKTANTLSMVEIIHFFENLILEHVPCFLAKFSSYNLVMADKFAPCSIITMYPFVKIDFYWQSVWYYTVTMYKNIGSVLGMNKCPGNGQPST